MSYHRSEFKLISDLFAPLAAGFPGALGLTDDAALLDPPSGYSVVVTTDAIISGVHFRPDDPPDLIARKLVRVNLSDLAAMGAQPWTMVAIVAFPHHVDMSWITRFAAGLGSDGRRFGISLIGGDTVTTPGPATFSLTAFGLVAQGQALRRSGAKPGDHLYVTGTIGDGSLGLQVLTGCLSLGPNKSGFTDYLRYRYYLPQPRLTVGSRLTGKATACVDISDGLLQDLFHLCQNSAVGACLAVERVPLSLAATAAVKQTASWVETVITGGDDYELLFTAPPGAETFLQQLAITAVTPITEVGEITVGNDVIVRDSTGKTLLFPSWGYQHFCANTARIGIQHQSLSEH